MSIFFFREQDGTQNVAVCGKVTRPPELKDTQNGTRIKFSVGYGKKKYMNCEARDGSMPFSVAECLEQGDVVLVAGTYSKWEYNGNTYSSLSADYINPMMLPYANTSTPQTDSLSETTTQPYTEIDDDSGELPF